MFEVREYLHNNNRAPFSDWLESLDRKTRARIDTRIDRLILGNFGDCKNVGEGVLELRLDFGPGYRVYFARQKNTIVLLLCGGDKSTQETDIKRAKRYWKIYQSREVGTSDEISRLSRSPKRET